MGLLIKSTEKRKIHILGTDVELDSVYARVGFKAHSNGRNMEIEIEIYYSKEKYHQGIKIFTDLHDGNILCSIDATNEIQSLDSVYTYAVQRYESMGYICEVI
jgi:hypothetical protein